MKIAVLTRAPRCSSTRRLVEAARARGHSIKPLDTLAFAITLRKGQPDLHYQGRPVPVYDAVVPRIGASITHFGAAVVRQLQQMDVYVANTANAILNARDKLRALQILSKHNVGIPATEFVRRREDVLPAIERVGGAPVIIKLLEGTQGVGVILADTIKIAEAIIETLQSAKQNVLIQKFVSESRGRDVRAIVAGDDPVAEVNVLGFARHSRYMPDRRDLNRSFPGQADGSLASRYAHAFFTRSCCAATPAWICTPRPSAGPTCPTCGPTCRTGASRSSLRALTRKSRSRARAPRGPCAAKPAEPACPRSFSKRASPGRSSPRLSKRACGACTMSCQRWQ